ncbi:enoyl-CoA hydratase/isomerase family protein [Cupriavidus alkaliphilus]|uniref:enoyl-CoA hydratase/isomerase family protein n=1 Tax=Cupriavidus alkaliphilus TaxID=942866 RepID=UPI0016156553|nr:enoyl-CoA hydratase-related protein [Cupriavidus alkaliphilus]MBB3014077.1 enoyl-CoA hydratase/carnithine racemase [Cupriavidus alkaliphilus]
MNQDVLLEPIGKDAFEIRLQRPERMNALGVDTCKALLNAVSQASAQRARVVLIRGSGRAFCAGADLKERQGMDLAGKLTHNAAIRAAIDALAGAKFVTVAVLNGMALGGGLELALGCDLRLAASGITLGLTESRVGAFPGAGGTQRLPRVIGASRALQMMLTGEPVDTDYALQAGLVNEVVAPEELDARARALAALIASRSAPALAAIKRLVYAGIEIPLADALQVERAALPEILGSADYAEGLAAFAEKRPPRFTGVA